MAREYKVLDRTGADRRACAKTLGFCDDISVNDAPFYVMELIDGKQS